MSSLSEIGAVFKQFRHVLQEMEQEMNKQLKNKYVLLDKSDSEAMVALSKVNAYWLFLCCISYSYFYFLYGSLVFTSSQFCIY